MCSNLWFPQRVFTFLQRLELESFSDGWWHRNLDWLLCRRWLSFWQALFTFFALTRLCLIIWLFCLLQFIKFGEIFWLMLSCTLEWHHFAVTILYMVDRYGSWNGSSHVFCLLFRAIYKFFKFWLDTFEIFRRNHLLLWRFTFWFWRQKSCIFLIRILSIVKRIKSRILLRLLKLVVLRVPRRIHFSQLDKFVLKLATFL